MNKIGSEIKGNLSSVGWVLSVVIVVAFVAPFIIKFARKVPVVGPVIDKAAA